MNFEETLRETKENSSYEMVAFCYRCYYRWHPVSPGGGPVGGPVGINICIQSGASIKTPQIDEDKAPQWPLYFLVLAFLDLWGVSDIGDDPFLKSFFRRLCDETDLICPGSYVGCPSSVCPWRVGVAKDSMPTFLPPFQSMRSVSSLLINTHRKMEPS